MEYRAQLKAANARPIKKVAEAKARKKLRAQRQWNKIRGKATRIADNPDLNERTKMKQIRQLYGKTLIKKKLPRVYMMTGPRGGTKPIGKGKVPKNAIRIKVDKRLKADKMGLKHSSKRKKAGKGKAASNKRQLNRKNKRRR